MFVVFDERVYTLHVGFLFKTRKNYQSMFKKKLCPEEKKKDRKAEYCSFRQKEFTPWHQIQPGWPDSGQTLQPV